MKKLIVGLIASAFLVGCEEKTKTEYVEVPVFPPPVVEPPPLPPPQATFLGLDWFEETLIRDASSLSSVDQVNAFYIIGCDRFNLGEELADFRRGVDKGINHLSTERIIEPVVAVTDCIFRIDITDYGLDDRQLLLLSDRSLFPVVSDTVRGDTLKFILQREITWQFADDLFNTGFEADILTDFAGNTYRDLVDQAADDAVFFDDEGVDTFQEFADEEALAAGTNSSLIAFNGRIFWSIESDNGFINRAFDSSLAFPGSINQDPFFIEEAVASGVQVTDKIYPFVATETLYSLPNLLMGVRLANDAGAAIGFAPADVVVDNRSAISSNGVNLERVIRPGACLDCHSAWTVGVTDEIRDNVLGSSSFDENEKLIALVFHNDDQNQERSRETNEVYARGLAQLDIDPNAPDPLNNRLLISMRSDYDAPKAAAKFFLTTAQYLDCLRNADVAQQNLGAHLTGGKVTLQVLSANFQTVIDECNLFQDIEL